MSAFVDTSAFIALFTPEDENHTSARKTWDRLKRRPGQMVTSNYVVVETCALLHRRLGLGAVCAFLEDIMCLVGIEWIDVHLHEVGVASLVMSTRKGPNIVDCVSFAVMRKLGIHNAFTFDQDFQEQGFNVL